MSSSRKKDFSKESQETDSSLVAKVTATKDTKAFSKLYDKYAQKVYAKCYSFSQNKTEAEDLTQDVFIKLFTKLNTFKGNASFSTWLYKFTYNFCINYVNRDKARKSSLATDKIERHEYYLSDNEDNTMDEVLFSIKVSLLEEALECIPAEDKVLLLLKYQDDISIKELGIIYKISDSAVKMRLTRARFRVLNYYKLKANTKTSRL